MAAARRSRSTPDEVLTDPQQEGLLVDRRGEDAESQIVDRPDYEG
jgi:hypothetical protein